jgi:hypothetical protein
MTSPSEWGPGAWQLLHGIAERIGRQTKKVLIQDEINALKFTLRHFWALLPCIKCQKHYKDWIQKMPPEWLNGSVYDLQESMRLWVYRLHENVNQSRDVVSGLTMDKMAEMYSSVPLRDKANELRKQYNDGILKRVFKAEEWKTAWKHLDMLLRVIG